MADDLNFDDLTFYFRKNNAGINKHVGIAKKGVITFAVKFFEDYKGYADGKEYVKCGYSAKNNCITVMFLSNEPHPSDCTALKAKRRGNNIVISMLGFCNKFGIDDKKIVGQYDVTYHETANFGNFFAIKLDKEEKKENTTQELVVEEVVTGLIIPNIPKSKIVAAVKDVKAEKIIKPKKEKKDDNDNAASRPLIKKKGVGRKS